VVRAAGYQAAVTVRADQGIGVCCSCGWDLLAIFFKLEQG